MSFRSLSPAASSGLAAGPSIGGAVTEIGRPWIDPPLGPGILVDTAPIAGTAATMYPESVWDPPTGRRRLGAALAAPFSVGGSNAEAAPIADDSSASPTLT